MTFHELCATSTGPKYNFGAKIESSAIVLSSRTRARILGTNGDLQGRQAAVLYTLCNLDGYCCRGFALCVVTSHAASICPHFDLEHVHCALPQFQFPWHELHDGQCVAALGISVVKGWECYPLFICIGTFRLSVPAPNLLHLHTRPSKLEVFSSLCHNMFKISFSRRRHRANCSTNNGQASLK